ncbi:MAG: hypothetical protein Q7S21_01720 [archaeon]|nr:hypothetical protein [archaeon]
MAIAQEILIVMGIIVLFIFLIMILLFRASNGIVSRKFAEVNERTAHLEKIARNHSMLKLKVEELEKKLERKEIIETTQEMITRAIEAQKKGK